MTLFAVYGWNVLALERSIRHKVRQLGFSVQVQFRGNISIEAPID
mgnify:CR=1 FL=1